MLIRHDPQPWSLDRLAEHFGVATRTVLRDMALLRSIGIETEHCPKRGGYVVRGDIFLQPLELTSEEAIALAVLCRQVAEPNRIAFTRPAARALDKLRSLLTDEIREEIDQLADSIVVQTGASTAPADDGSASPTSGDGGEDDDPSLTYYNTVRTAIAARRCVICRYASRNSDTPDEEFDFEPYRLFFSQRAWYVIGYHSERDAVRTLKLQRFRSVRQTHREYRIPENFSLSSYLGNAWRMLRSDRDYDVELHFDAGFAGTIAEANWHHTQQLEWHDDRSLTFRCRVSGLDEIVWWVLSMGPHCRVVQPRELAQRVRDLAAKTAALYGSDGNGSGGGAPA